MTILARALADEEPVGMTAHRCDQCFKWKPEQCRLLVDSTDWGFCSVACMVLFVRSTYMEADCARR